MHHKILIWCESLFGDAAIRETEYQAEQGKDRHMEVILGMDCEYSTERVIALRSVNQSPAITHQLGTFMKVAIDDTCKYNGKGNIYLNKNTESPNKFKSAPNNLPHVTIKET